MASLLEEWKWILDEPSRVILTTTMGDLFVRGNSSKIYYLDVVSGESHTISKNSQEFEKLLNDNQFIIDYFYPERVDKLKKLGLILEENCCYSHIHPLVLGGEDIIDNIEVTDLIVHLSITGQIHKQIKDLDYGTRITDIL
jgi:hypothetical protein